MDNALIVSGTDKGTAYFHELLSNASIGRIAALSSCSEARRELMECDYDLVLINSPLRDETGRSLACSIAAKGYSQVILVVKTEHFDAMASACEDDGVLIVAKPVNRALFQSVLKLINSTQHRLRKAYTENEKLKQKIEDIRIIDRAKCILISHMNMSEKEAHRYIEKQAMDMRSTKRAVAEGLLKTYEN